MPEAKPKAQPKSDEDILGETLPPYISEGTAKEIEMYGFAVDPRDGSRLTESDLPSGRRK